MDDQQPPKKKSRFFSERKVFLGSLLHRSISNSASTTDDDRSNSSLPPQRPSLVDIAPICDTTPRTIVTAESVTTDDSTRVTPTATAFQALSVDEKGTRRKAIYGAQDLLGDANERGGSAVKQENTAHKRTASPDVPWMSAIQQREQHQEFSHDTYVRAGQQPHFTFRAPVRPAILYHQSGHLPFAQVSALPSIHVSPSQAHIPGPQLVRSPNLSDLNVRKQRSNLQPTPQSPITPSFPAIPGINTPARPPRTSGSSQVRAEDLDRDARGLRVPFHPTSAGVTNVPLPATAVPVRTSYSQRRVPQNALTSPNRVKRAISFASRKRKRGGIEMPPPSYIYTRTNDPNFSVFQGILLYPELCFHLASHLPVDDLISLYSISRDYHTILDSRFTTVILTQAQKKAPSSGHIYPFRSYGHMCRKDPAARIPHPNPAKAAAGVVRYVPSFRWLKMVMFREKTVHAIMALFAERGIPLPRRCELSLKKLWFMLDIPDNARRIGYVHNTQLFSDLDLYFAACFFVKLDMLFTDPAATHKRAEGRRLIMSQRSLSKLLEVLKGEALSTRWQILQAWVEWKYESVGELDALDEPDTRETMFGIPRADWGRLKREHWGRKLTLEGRPVPKDELLLLLRPDQLIVREAVRRGLRFAGHYVKFMLYGYVHPKTMEDFDPRELTRWIGEYNEDDYTVNDMVAGTQALSVEAGGDPLLDLGPKFTVGRSIVHPTITRTEQVYKAKENAFIDQLYAASEQERRDLGLL